MQQAQQGALSSEQGSEGGYEECLAKAVQLCAHMHCLVGSRPVAHGACRAQHARCWLTSIVRASLAGGQGRLG